MANSPARKRQILEHVDRTINMDPTRRVTDRESRKQKVMDHVKQTRG